MTQSKAQKYYKKIEIENEFNWDDLRELMLIIESQLNKYKLLDKRYTLGEIIEHINNLEKPK